MDLHSPDFCRTLVEETADAVIYSDADGLIRFWRKGAERIFGFSKAGAIGQSLDISVPENLRQRHSDGYAKRMRYGDGDALSAPAMRKHGTRLSIEFTILPFHDKAGRIAGIAAILRDVTKRFEEMKTLRRQAHHATF